MAQKPRPLGFPRPARGQRYEDLTGEAFVASTGVGDVWVIVEVDRRYIRVRPEDLIDEESMEDEFARRFSKVDRHAADVWPPEGVAYLGEAGAKEGEATAVQAMVVGGAGGRHWRRIFKLSGELGVHAMNHVDESRVKRAPAIIPRDVELLILLISHGGHSMEDRFVGAARAAGVPYVRVPSQGFSAVLGDYLSGHPELYKGLYGGLNPSRVDWWWEWTDHGWELRTLDDSEIERQGRPGYGSLWTALAAAAAAVFFWRSS